VSLEKNSINLYNKVRLKFTLNKDQSIVAACTVHLHEDVWVADDNQEGLGSCDGHVEPLRVAEETQSMPFIKTHQILI